MINPMVEYHCVSYTRYRNGQERCRHTWVDARSLKVISEDLGVPAAVDSGPWTWEEIILVGVSDLLERRRVDDEATLY